MLVARQTFQYASPATGASTPIVRPAAQQTPFATSSFQPLLLMGFSTPVSRQLHLYINLQHTFQEPLQTDPSACPKSSIPARSKSLTLACPKSLVLSQVDPNEADYLNRPPTPIFQVPSLPLAPANADVIDGLLAKMNEELNRCFVHEPKELRDKDLPPMPLDCPEMVY
jgi:hypothetical protein